MAGLDPLTAVLNLGGSIIDKIWPDKNEAEKAKVQLASLAMQGQLEDLKAQTQLLVSQMAINQEEAKSNSVFVAGWRPFIGWVCGSAMAYYYILQPFLVWVFDVFNIQTGMPKLDTGDLMMILMGMLGLGAFRSYDKTQEIKKNGK